MPFYRDLDASKPVGKRTIEGLLALRDLFAREGIPDRDLEDTLLLATWNIREFEDASYGRRLTESYYYIAEVVSRFDLVAVQEVRPNLAAFDRLLEILGSHWKYLVTDVTKGSAGNRERIAFLYDSRKLRLGGIAGEVVLPPIDGRPVDQIARTPYVVGFKAGWTRFLLASVHILWGDDHAENPQRVREISTVAKAMAEEATGRDAWTRNVILLGDFNIFEPTDATMTALTAEGFIVPEAITGQATNIDLSKTYDQIAYHRDADRLTFTGKGGIVPFFDAVFTDAQAAVFAPTLKKADGSAPADPEAYYRRWRTYQMSDHVPLWVQLRIDYSRTYLERKLAGDA